ncbi:hypothetical protein [Rubritalea tangerina]
MAGFRVPSSTHTIDSLEEAKAEALRTQRALVILKSVENSQ